MTTRLSQLAAFALALLLLAPSALAQDLTTADRPVLSADDVPTRFTYSGLLTDADGEALADGTRALVFRGYATPEAARMGGAPDWEETHEVAVVGGRFLTVLGSRADVPAAVRYVTVAVDGEGASAAVPLGRTGASDGFAPGNTLQDSYLNGRTITTGGSTSAVQIQGPANTIGLTVRDVTAVFTTDQLTRFRLTSTSGGGSPGSAQIWEYRVYGSNNVEPGPGTFSIADATGGGADGFTMFPGVAENVLNLRGTTVNVGNETSPREFRAFTTPNPVDPANGFVGMLVNNFANIGAQALLYEETGNLHTSLQPDATGTGGFFHVRGSNGATGFLVNGNNGSGGTAVNIGTGVGSSFFNSTAATSTGTVQLPTDAIDATEILNEAGTANATNSGVVGLTTGQQNVTLSRSITAPSAGFVIAYATGELRIAHTTGTTDFVRYSVSRDCDATPTAPTTQQSDYGIPSGAASGTYQYATTVQGLFSVAAGTTTFCAQVNPLTTGSSASIDDQNLTLLFVPTAYGAVQSNLQDDGGEEGREAPQAALSSGDIAAERAASIQANEARESAEMAALRARIEALEASMANDPNGQ